MTRVLINTGDGKGKTTAALGMVLRAVGHGQTVSIIQFLKSNDTVGELQALRTLPGVEVAQFGCGFVPKPDHPEYSKHRDAARQGLDAARAAVSAAHHQLYVFDELIGAAAKGLIAEADVLDLVSNAATDVVMVLTGRGATPALLAAADTVTEMVCRKHGYQAGIQAQKGVEF